jgi:nucleotide-binding universal stress UspA family protein
VTLEAPTLARPRTSRHATSILLSETAAIRHNTSEGCDPQQGGGMATLARILCAIDLEKASERAFDRALNLAIISGAKLHLLHATPANVPFSRRATERLQYLTALRERAEAAGVKVRVEEQHGDPARVIVLHANARKVDLVVLGSNRRRGWRRLREGSISERVLRHAAWPVLIVPWDARRTGVLGQKTSLAPKSRSLRGI